MTLESVSALILDDNAHMRGLLRVILAGFGMRQIEEASNCAEAIALINDAQIDIAFVDFKLGEQDGIAFCQYIRRDPGCPNRWLPLVMVTAYSERGRVVDAINAGVDEFLVKPVRAVDVANRINAVIERRRPFIEVPSYFGPDRRRRDDPRYKGAWRRITDPGTINV